VRLSGPDNLGAVGPMGLLHDSCSALTMTVSYLEKLNLQQRRAARRHGVFRRVSGPSSDVGLPPGPHITAHNARRGRGIGRRRSECTYRSDWMSAATMPSWILDSEMKGDGRPSRPWGGWTVAVAVLSSGALSDPIRTHRRQHRLCYNAVFVPSSALCRVRQIGAEGSATHLN
jgi:hypothetical protein